MLSRVSRPQPRAVRWFALAVLVAQALISVTGSIVRVTGSGLGCPTWPQCFPGSMVPVAHPEVATLHQVIEFGNRTMTSVVGFIALACFFAAWRARPYRRRLVLLAAVMPLGVLAQAIIGGLTVLVDLQWWSVALHFMASAVLIWLAAYLFNAAGEADQEPLWVITGRMRKLLVALTTVAFAMVFAGTLVTAAGPHAGDQDTPRLALPVVSLTQAHGLLVTAYVCLLAVFGVWLRSAQPTKSLLRTYVGACLVVLAQGAIGYTQYLLGVPAAMVVLHVLGATLVITSVALLWCKSRYRGPAPVVPNTSDESTKDPVGA